jgi:hypothetical protein
MIYLFDNCFLAIPETIDEVSKHVWVGDFDYSEESFFQFSFDVYKNFSSITPAKIEQLFIDIHENLAGQKVIIYADDVSFQKIYSYFFGALLSKEGLQKLYDYDRDKHNFRITPVLDNSIFLFKEYKLPEKLKLTTTFSEFAKTCEVRIELAIVNYFLGDDSFLDYCLDRFTKFFKPTKKNHLSEVEAWNLLPLFIDGDITDKFQDEQYLKDNVNNILDSDNPFSEINQVSSLTFISRKNDEITNVITIPDNTSRESLKNFLLNKDTSKKIAKQISQGFPTPKNYDSINPLLIRDLYINIDNSTWLETFKINYGTDNQTDGTV